MRRDFFRRIKKPRRMIAPYGCSAWSLRMTSRCSALKLSLRSPTHFVSGASWPEKFCLCTRQTETSDSRESLCVLSYVIVGPPFLRISIIKLRSNWSARNDKNENIRQTTEAQWFAVCSRFFFWEDFENWKDLVIMNM